MSVATKTRQRPGCVDGCGSHASRRAKICVIAERVPEDGPTVGITYVQFPNEGPPQALRQIWRRRDQAWTDPKPLPHRPGATWAPAVEWARNLIANPPSRRGAP